MPVVGVRSGGHDDEVGEDTVRDISLRAVEEEVVALVLGLGAHAGNVAAGAGLRHGHGEYLLATDAGGQPALFLFVRAESANVWPDEAAVQPEKEPLVAVFRVLFHHDLLVTEVLDTCAAILLVGPHAQEAHLAGLEEGLAVDHPGLVPAVAVRCNFVLEEASYGVTKHLVVFVKDESVHCFQSACYSDYLPVNSGARFSKNAAMPSCASSDSSSDACSSASRS